MPRIMGWLSVPWGVVSLTESEAQGSLTEPRREARRLSPHARARPPRLQPLCGDASGRGKENIRLMGTSGTVTTLASVRPRPLPGAEFDGKTIISLQGGDVASPSSRSRC